MSYFLYGLFFISCLVLIASVLLQPGKTDAGALFTSNVSSAAFGPRGTATILSKITITAATTFMLSALLLAMPALRGDGSVVPNYGDAPQTEQQSPVTDPPISNLNIDSNANTNVQPATNLSIGNTNANANATTNTNATTKPNTSTSPKASPSPKK